MTIELFLKLDGIKGESLDKAHKDEIEVLSYSWGESNPVAPGGGGGGAGKVVMQDFNFVMHVNQASPQLLLACASGTHIKNAILAVRRGGASPFEFLKWTLTDVLVSSYQEAGTHGDAPPTDQVSLRFGKIEVEYKTQRANGAAGAPVKSGWNVLTNMPA